jgi:hypothetical protein
MTLYHTLRLTDITGLLNITRLLNIIHYGITAFILLGWITSSPKVLIFHLFGTISIGLHWMVNHGRCIISEVCGHGDNEFTNGILQKFNIDIKIKEGVMYIALFVLATITYTRLYFIYNNSN